MFLPPLWENQLFQNIINSKMLQSESFLEFTDHVIASNNLLEGSKFCLGVDQLRETLILNMGKYLDSKWQNLRQTEHERIETITIFDDWLLELVTIDNQANFDLKRVVDMAADHVAKCQRLNPMYEHPQQYDHSMNRHLSATQNQYPPDEN